jgi:nitronate monooxygenase
VTLRELLGTDLPIVQAPMAGVQGAALAAAVTGAGGLGSIPAAQLGDDALRGEVQAFRAAVDGPVNLNFFCHAEPAPDPAREEAWLAALAPYDAELGIDRAGLPAGPGRRPFTAAAADLLEELRPPVVSFHFVLPEPALLARLKALSAVVLSTATTVDEARWLEAHGVDAVVAQGYEAGGHRGMFLARDPGSQLGTLALVRRVVDAVGVPVLAAGGIVDPQGVAAVVALGAAGAQVGTAYLRCPETATSAVHRAALAAGGETAVTNVITGAPARGIVNRAIRELGPLNPAAPAFPRAVAAMAPLRAAAEARGSGDFSPLWCGQNPRCPEIPAAELTQELGSAA